MLVSPFLCVEESSRKMSVTAPLASSTKPLLPPLFISTSIHCGLLRGADGFSNPCPAVTQQGIEQRALRFARFQETTSSPSSSSSSRQLLSIVVKPPSGFLEQLMFPAVLQAWQVATDSSAHYDVSHESHDADITSGPITPSSSSPSESTGVIAKQEKETSGANKQHDGFHVATQIFEKHFGITATVSHSAAAPSVLSEGATSHTSMKRPREE